MIRRKLLPLLCLVGFTLAHAQVSVFDETLGSLTNTTSLAQYNVLQAFDQDALLFSDGGAANPVDFRNSSSSNGAYQQWNGNPASGNANVWFSSSGERGFSIAQIRAAAFDSLQLYFAYRKESASTNSDFNLDWSADNGQTWNNLSLSNLLPSAGDATGWYYLGPIALPDSAITNTLALRWIKNSGSMRIDDISLSGKITQPLLRANRSTMDFSSSVAYAPSSWQSIQIQSDAFSVDDSIYLQTNFPFSIASDTLHADTLLLLEVDSSSMSTPFWIRMEAAEIRGAKEGELLIYAEVADTLLVPLSGFSSFAGEEATLWDCASSQSQSNGAAYQFSSFEQKNNYGSTQFISSSVSSDNYAGASAGNNAALAVQTGSFNSNSSAYIAWSIVPDSNKEIHLISLSFGARATSSGPRSWCLRSSQDGFQANIFEGSISTNSSWSKIETLDSGICLSISDSTYFKLFVYDGQGSASINIANFRLDDLELKLASWNDFRSAKYRSRGDGNFHSSTTWDYNYFDTLYRNALSHPDTSNSLYIRGADSLWLSVSDTFGSILLEGKLGLAANNLRLLGDLHGAGSLIGHPQSTLQFSGTNDSNILNLDQSQSKNSNSLYRLINDGSSDVYLIDTVFIQDALKIESGTLHSRNTLRLLYGESGSAQVLPGGNGGISGAMCMQTLIPGTRAGWRSIQSPLDTVTLGQLGSQIELHLTNTASSGDNRNAFIWQEATANWATVGSHHFSLHDQAIHLYVFNPDSSIIELCGLYDTTSVSFGALGFNQSSAQTEGWHLVGNPFPSTIAWDKVNFPTGINGNYAVWSEADGNYRAWNGSVGTAGNLIPPFQGFWVKNNQALNEDFILDRVCWDTGQINHFAKRDLLSWHVRCELIGQNGFKDAIDLFEIEDQSNSTSDAPKLYGNELAPQLWVIKNDNAWTIKSCPTEKDIALGIRVKSSGTYRFSFSPLISSSETWSLFDKKTGKVYPLKPNQPLALELESGTWVERYYLQRTPLDIKRPASLGAPEVFIQEGMLVISADNISEITLYQMDGKRLRTFAGETHPKGTQFELTGYPSGLYILHYQVNNQNYQQLFYLP